MNLTTKGVLQNKMKERSRTQMCVSKGKGLRTGFSLKMMGWRPNETEPAGNMKLPNKKIEFDLPILC